MSVIDFCVWPLLCGLFLSYLVEQSLHPRPTLPWRRPSVCLPIHCGTWIATFAIIVTLLERPWFSVTLILAFQLLLVLVNHAKYESLREAFFFQDFEYFTDAIKHPRLYLPFFGILRTVLAVIGFVAAFALGFSLETPITEQLSIAQTVSGYAVLLGFGSALIYFAIPHLPDSHFEPNEDLRRLGQFTFFWKYWHEERRTSIDTSKSPFTAAPRYKGEASALSHLVVVQSESFFDPRPHFDLIETDVLVQFDRIKSEASHHGRLKVPAWGANTVRTECGFLSGLPPEQMGVHRFNPYRTLAKQNIPNLARTLRQMGYQTICVHPYPVSFYQRDQVFPRLGFDRFIDIQDFQDEQKCGQYIGDLAVAEKIQTLLHQESDIPLFIFVITMENHGPLHLEQAPDSEIQSFYREPPPDDCSDLSVYLRHLRNADRMIDYLANGLQTCRRPGTLCWYGDHVPIMPDVYRHFGNPDGLTDYVIWQSDPLIRANTAAKKKTVHAHELATTLLATL